MRERLAITAIGALAALASFGAASASAAVEFGSNCEADRSESNQIYSVIQLAQNGIPTVAPVSGVVTKWKLRNLPVLLIVPQQLKVFRPTADPTQFQVVGESSMELTGKGENVFSTRIPILAGDRIGLFGNSETGTLFCAETPETENPGDSIGEFTGNPATGSIAKLSKTKTEQLVPVRAVIEPDADHDGFGDETQDGCPQSAGFQGPCPTVTIDSVSLAAKTKAVVRVTTDNQTPVKVNGTVRLGKGKRAKMKAGPKTVRSGRIARFSLKFSKQLRRALKGLPANRKLALKITAHATDVLGRVSTDRSTLKLEGQGHR